MTCNFFFFYRVRTIPKKLPSIQYPILLGLADTNTQYQYWYRLPAMFPATARHEKWSVLC